MVQPEVPTPNIVQPEVPTPNMVQPEVPTPNTVQPEVPTPNMVQPEISQIDLNNGMVPPIETPTYNEEPEEKKKHSALPAILIILILLVGIAFVIYKFLFNKPDKIVKGLINQAYDKFATPIEKYDTKEEPILINTDLSINTNIQGLEDLNGMKLNMTTGIDYKNKKMEIGASYLEDNNKIVEAFMYLLDENAYVSLKDIYENPIKVDMEGMNFERLFNNSSNISSKDAEFISKRIKDILIESLDMKDFKQSNDTITLNGSETKVKKISYTLDSNKATNLVNNFITNMENDKELMAKLAEISNTDTETLKDKLDMSKVQGNTDVLNGETIKFDIYTKGLTDEFVGMDIELPENSNIKLRKNNDDTTVTANISGVSMISTIKSESEEKSTIDIKINVAGEEITGLITLNNKEIDSKSSESSMTFNMTYKEQSINLTMNMKQQIGATIASIDTTNAKSSEEITEEEMNLIGTKLMEKLEGSKLYGLIYGAFENNASLLEQDYGDYGLNYNNEL